MLRIITGSCSRTSANISIIFTHIVPNIMRLTGCRRRGSGSGCHLGFQTFHGVGWVHGGQPRAGAASARRAHWSSAGRLHKQFTVTQGHAGNPREVADTELGTSQVRSGLLSSARVHLAAWFTTFWVQSAELADLNRPPWWSGQALLSLADSPQWHRGVLPKYNILRLCAASWGVFVTLLCTTSCQVHGHT